VKRTYVSPLRQAQAAQTRASIVEAARLLFDLHGYAATTLDMIAQQSQMSPNTLYVVFRTKAAILHAILRRANPEDITAATVASALEEHDPRRQLRVLVDRYVALNSADDGLFSIASNAALTDPDAAIWWENAQNSEWLDLRTLAARWERDGCLKEALSADEATNSLWAMTRPSLIRSFVHDCGWSADQCAAWLMSTLDHAVLDPDYVAPEKAAAPRKAAPKAAEPAKRRRPAAREDQPNGGPSRQA
jgi:AcrR family transcriptional regulator